MDFETGSKIKACIPDVASFGSLRDEAQSAILEFTQGSMPADVFLKGMSEMHEVYLTIAECVVSAFQVVL